MIINVSRANKDVYRVEVNDEIIGFALRMANDMWRPYAPDMKTAVGRSYKTPKSAAKALIEAVS